MHASHEALTLRSPVAHPGSPWLTQLARCECLKRHGVGEREGELGADFTSLVMPRFYMHSNLSLVVVGRDLQLHARTEERILILVSSRAFSATVVLDFRTCSCTWLLFDRKSRTIMLTAVSANSRPVHPSNSPQLFACDIGLFRAALRKEPLSQSHHPQLWIRRS